MIISITVISWSSCARNTLISTNSLYIQSSLTASPTLLTPSLTNQFSNENFVLIPNNVLNKKNFLFETTMIFNDKLQQLIAFFTNFHSDSKDLASANLQDSTIGTLKIKNCKESS